MFAARVPCQPCAVSAALLTVACWALQEQLAQNQALKGRLAQLSASLPPPRSPPRTAARTQSYKLVEI